MLGDEPIMSSGPLASSPGKDVERTGAAICLRCTDQLARSVEVTCSRLVKETDRSALCQRRRGAFLSSRNVMRPSIGEEVTEDVERACLSISDGKVAT